MTIILDEIVCASNKVPASIIDKITHGLSFGLRKPKREKIKYLFTQINNRDMWHYVQTELIFFKGSLNNLCFFNYSKENFETFLKNLEHIEKEEFNKIKNIDMNYKNYMRIFEETDDYALNFPNKKQSILKALAPVFRHIKPLSIIKEDR